VNRGGGFNNPASNARSANRNNDTPENRNNNLGVRPASVSPEPVASSHWLRPPDRGGLPRQPGVRRAVLRETPTSLPCRGPARGRTGARRRGP
jgi:hypothetical protein